MFFGREKELAALEELYRSGEFVCAALYGRPGVGKTALLRRFLENKKAVFFTGVESSARQNLENISRDMAECMDSLQEGTLFSSVPAALEYAIRGAEQERLLLVLDDFPAADKAVGGLAEELGRLADLYRDRSKAMVILCAASPVYAEERFLSPRSPLYGRLTARMELQPFDFQEASRFFRGYSAVDKALSYGVFGGTPGYLSLVDDDRSVGENIRRLFLDSASPLFREPENLLRREVREPAVYSTILSAIAGGAERMAEISARTGEDTNVCSAYLKKLMALGMVKKETPYGENAPRKTVYSITDNMLRFWYRFVPENASLIGRGDADAAYRRGVRGLDDLMGRAFTDVCMQYLRKMRQAGKAPVAFTSPGRWWGTDPARKTPVSIDIMGEQDRDTALFGRCLWDGDRFSRRELEALAEASRLFPYRKVHYFLFSRSGFTRECAELGGGMGNVTMVSFDSSSIKVDR